MNNPTVVVLIGALMSLGLTRTAAAPMPTDLSSAADVAVRGATNGWPHVVLEAASFNATTPTVDRRGRRTRALTLVLADLDGDGIDDAVAGYAEGDGGLIVLRSGSGDAFLPYRNGVQGEYSPDGFLDEVRTIAVDTVPEFLGTGDFNADGAVDFVLGSRADSQLEIRFGDASGKYDQKTHLALAGPPSAMLAADVNRRDGLADIVVATNGPKPELLILESVQGAVNAEGRVVALSRPAVDLAADNVVGDYATDIVAATGDAVVIVEGRDNQTYRLESHSRPMSASSVQVAKKGNAASGFVAVTTGRFVGSANPDIAALTSEGSLYLLDGETLAVVDTPYDFPDAVAASRANGPIGATELPRRGGTLISAQTATLRGDDLIVVERDAWRMSILHAHHFLEAASRGDSRFELGDDRYLPSPIPSPVRLETASPPVAVVAQRVNGDGLDDLIVLSDTDNPVTADLSTSFTLPAGVWLVNDTGNEPDDNPGDGVCDTAGGVCTLRAAIQEVNSAEGAHEIQFSVTGIEATISDRHGTITRTTFVNGFSNGRVELLSQYGNIAFSSLAPEGSVVRGMSVSSLTGYDGVVVEGNHVGVSHDGNAVREGSSGLNLLGVGGAVGGRTPSVRNVLLRVQIGAESVIEGNYIGLDASGSLGLYQASHGIRSSGVAENVTIGGLDLGAGNVISGHGSAPGLFSGIAVAGDGLIVQGNLIGTDATGTLAIPNSGSGITSGYDILIGGSTRAARNVIAASGQHGVSLSGSDANPVVQGNYIGTDATGRVGMGNLLAGIRISRASATIGGLDAGNVISGNGWSGIDISDTQSGPHQIVNNLIGSDESGRQPIPNGEYGIETIAETGVAIGGTSSEGNVIAFNGKGGVNATRRMTSIRGNSIFANTELGVTLRNSATPGQNDSSGDPAEDPRDEQNYPVLTDAGGTSVTITLDSRPDETFAVDVYGNESCDASGHGEGRVLLETFDLTTDGSGHGAATRMLSVDAATGVVSATATAADNSTSEFSNCVELDVPRLLVRALQDVTNPRPLVHRSFDYGHFDGADASRDGVYEIVGSAVSDENGIVKLNPAAFNPGDAFFLRAEHSARPGVRGGTLGDRDALYTIHIDNLTMDPGGTVMEAPHLSSDPEVTTETFVDRATVGYNLVVSVEWDPSDTYASGLIEALRNTSNLLLDVTDGHAYLNAVSLYGNRERWDEADIRIYADNTKWPSAERASVGTSSGSLHFPPAHFGSAENNVVRNTVPFPLDPNEPSNYATLVHELGHYLFGLYDEYLDASNAVLPDVENWSVMDKQYPRYGPNASELAWDPVPGYKLTRQFVLSGGKTGWHDFASQFEQTGGSVDARLPVPTMRRDGPNRDLSSPDFNLGGGMEVFDQMPRRAGNPIVMQVTVDGAPASGALVAVVKASGREINQGKTLSSTVPSVDGGIVLRGADSGDRVIVSRRSGVTVWESADELVPAGSGIVATKSGHGLPPVTPDFEVALQRLTGDYSMVPVVLLDGPNTVRLTVQALGLASEPEIAVADVDGAAVTASVTHEGDEHLVDAVGIAPSGSPYQLLFTGQDDAANNYFIPGTLELLHVAAVPHDTASGQPSGGTAVGDRLPFELDLDDASSIDVVAAFGHDFPTPRAGLPDSVIRVSPVLAIDAFGDQVQLDGDLVIYWNAGRRVAATESAVNIYRWDGQQWAGLDTRVVPDTSNQVARAVWEGPGTYAAFLDLMQAGTVGTESFDGEGDCDCARNAISEIDLTYYPAPFRESTTVHFVLERDADVQLAVFDVLGRHTATIIDERVAAGEVHVLVGDPRWPAGVYFARIRVAGEDYVLQLVKAG